MIHAKNYETVSTFVEVMQRKLWPLFSGHSVKLENLLHFATFVSRNYVLIRVLSV